MIIEIRDLLSEKFVECSIGVVGEHEDSTICFKIHDDSSEEFHFDLSELESMCKALRHQVDTTVKMWGRINK